MIQCSSDPRTAARTVTHSWSSSFRAALAWEQYTTLPSRGCVGLNMSIMGCPVQNLHCWTMSSSWNSEQGNQVSAEPVFHEDLHSAHPFGGPHLSAADGQSPVEERPGHGLFAARRRHGAHVAVITVKLPRWRDQVTESEVWDHRPAACTDTSQERKIPADVC